MKDGRTAQQRQNTAQTNDCSGPSAFLSDEDLRHLDPGILQTREQAAEAMARLDDIIGDIGAQITAAKGLAVSEGKYSDREWFIGVQRALKGAKTSRNLAQIRMGELTRAQKEKAQQSMERRFVDAAKLLLTPEQFAQIILLATESR